MFTLSPPFWGAEDGDPYWSYVKLLLHFDGDYVDSSPVAGSYAAAGGAVITTADQLYGSGALDCTASASAVASGNNAALAMSAGDFCVECFFKDPNTPGANELFWLLESASTANTVSLKTSASQLVVDVSGVGPAGSVAYTYNVWHHAAVTRSGNSFTFWFNGTAAQTWTNTTLLMTGNISVRVGRATSLGSGRRAYIDDFRVTVGVPRYTAPFTPAGPFPNRGL